MFERIDKDGEGQLSLEQPGVNVREGRTTTFASRGEGQSCG